MAQKQKEKKQSLLSLETTNHDEFSRRLRKMGCSIKEWEKVKKTIAKQIMSARCSTDPKLTCGKLGNKLGINKVSMYSYENGTRLPQMFNLWLVAEACGRKLKITLE